MKMHNISTHSRTDIDCVAVVIIILLSCTNTLGYGTLVTRIATSPFSIEPQNLEWDSWSHCFNQLLNIIPNAVSKESTEKMHSTFLLVQTPSSCCAASALPSNQKSVSTKISKKKLMTWSIALKIIFLLFIVWLLWSFTFQCSPFTFFYLYFSDVKKFANSSLKLTCCTEKSYFPHPMDELADLIYTLAVFSVPMWI